MKSFFQIDYVSFHKASSLVILLKTLVLFYNFSRKDCLRQFIVVLCEKGELKELVEFPYTDLQEEVSDMSRNISFIFSA